MPSSSRPTSSMFWQIIKSALFDTSLKRVLNSEGGQNLTTVFAYFSSLAFKELLLTPVHPDGDTGKDLFLQAPNQSLSILEFLNKSGMLGDKSPNTYQLTVVERLLDSFVVDKALSRSEDSGRKVYQYIEDLEFPEDSQIETARKSNKYLILAGEDLICYTLKSIRNGQGAVGLNDSKNTLLFEALFSDPLFEHTRKETTDKVLKDSLEFKYIDEIKVVDFGVNAGGGTIHFLDYLVHTYPKRTISLTGVANSTGFLARTRMNYNTYLHANRGSIAEKGATLETNFLNLEFGDYSALEGLNGKVDVIYFPQILMFFSQEDQNRLLKLASELLIPNGTVILLHSSSHSDDFPFPFFYLYMNIDKFVDFPTKEHLELVCKQYFASVKSSNLDSIWILRKPKR